MSESTTHAGERARDVAAESKRIPAESDWRLRWGAYLLALSGLGVVANGLAMVYRAFFDPGFESGVHTLDGVTRAELAGTHPEVVSYVDHLHVNVAGLLIPVGIAMVALAWYGVRRGERWAFGASIALPLVFLVHSLPVHRTADFSFHAVAHLGPGLVWLPALGLGAVLAAVGLRSTASPS